MQKKNPTFGQTIACFHQCVKAFVQIESSLVKLKQTEAKFGPKDAELRARAQTESHL